MTLGSTPSQADIFRSTTEFCAPRVAQDSIHALLHRECFALFPDALFGDLFAEQRAALGPAAHRRGRDGPPASRGLLGPRGGRAVHLRRALEVRGGWPALRLPRLRPYRARRHAGAPGPLGTAQPDLRGDARGGAAGGARRGPAGARLDAAL